jgi:N-acetylmuramoyl-L-alanine amidase
MDMNERRRSVMRRRILREAVTANLEDIGDALPRGLRRPGADLRRVSRLLTAAMAIVLGSAVGARLPEPMPEGSAAHPLGASASPADPAGADERALEFSPGAAIAGEAPRDAAFGAPPAIDPAVLRLAMRKIVIDAGHGGIDSGARSAGGIYEKDLTLDIARRLEVALRERGFAVAMTREEDETVSLRERSARANRAHGDLFLSIHVNSLPRRDGRGVETYYLGPPSDSGGSALATAENAESGYSVADVRAVLEGIYVNMRASDSQALAETVQRRLYESLRRASPDLEDRGVKTAPFVVLVGAAMPGILAEVSCISNEKEAALLEQPSHRQRIAEALASGIRAYASTKQQDRLLASVSR